MGEISIKFPCSCLSCLSRLSYGYGANNVTVLVILRISPIILLLWEKGSRKVCVGMGYLMLN